MNLVRDVAAVTEAAADKLRKVNLFETARFFCDVYVAGPGQSQATHVHGASDKVYVVLSGRGTVTVGDARHDVDLRAWRVVDQVPALVRARDEHDGFTRTAGRAQRGERCSPAGAEDRKLTIGPECVVGRLDERVRKLQLHFGQANKDLDDILTSTKKITSTGDRIQALEFDDPDGQRRRPPRPANADGPPELPLRSAEQA